MHSSYSWYVFAGLNLSPWRSKELTQSVRLSQTTTKPPEMDIHLITESDEKLTWWCDKTNNCITYQGGDMIEFQTNITKLSEQGPLTT